MAEITAELAAALDAINAAKRLRWLCSDENSDAASRAAYRDLVIRQASGAEPAAPVAVSQVPVNYEPVVYASRSCCG